MCLLLTLFLLLNVCAASADDSSDGVSSVDPVNQSDHFSAVLYDNTNGLPTSEANAIVQTSEGFLWIGSYAGLIRYDGNTFERMDSTGGIASIKCLYVDSRDRLWMGTNDNGDTFGHLRAVLQHTVLSGGVNEVHPLVDRHVVRVK